MLVRRGAASQDDEEAGNQTVEDEIGTRPDAPIIDAQTTEVVATVCLPSGKEYLTLSTFVNVDSDNIATMGSAP